jgi:hypothetical protein
MGETPRKAITRILQAECSFTADANKLKHLATRVRSEGTVAVCTHVFVLILPRREDVPIATGPTKMWDWKQKIPSNASNSVTELWTSIESCFGR